VQSETTPESAPFGREPFSPTGRRGKGPGGSRWALLGCGALIVLLGIGSVVFLLKAKDLFSWMMDELETEIMQSLPADMTEAEKSELSAAFDAAVQAVQEDRASAADLQGLQQLLREALRDGAGRLSREEVEELIEALDRVSGRASEGGSAAAEPQLDAYPAAAAPGPEADSTE
jgi:hypothetical protein